MNNKKNSWASTIGYIVGSTIVTCVGLCLAGGLIALTVKFLFILFNWLFL